MSATHPSAVPGDGFSPVGRSLEPLDAVAAGASVSAPALDSAPEMTGADDGPRPKRPLRLAELVLLLLAIGISIGGYVLLSVQMTGELPEELLARTIELSAVSLIMHIAIRIRAPFADQTILPSVVLLTGIGLTMIERLEMGGSRDANASRSALWAIISVVVAAAIILAIGNHRFLQRLTYTSGIAGIVLLLSPLIPGLGETRNGATAWLNIGGLSVQPGEFATILLAIFFAGYLARARDNLALAGPKFLGLQLPRPRDLGPIVVVWAVAVFVLVAQTDLGMSLMLFGMFVSMLYIATQRVSWIAIGALLVGVGGWFAIGAFPHVAQRFDGWLSAMDPAVYHRVGGSFQIVQGWFAMAAGGLFGTGLGRGNPSLVPFAFSDFIYTSLAEELGLTGMLAILVIFLIITMRGLRIGLEVRDPFGKLLAAGLAFMFAWQLFVIVGGITRVLPLTGLTVPFMAQGGSSLLSKWIVVALLIVVSDAARRPSSDPGMGLIAQMRGGAARRSEP